jgi:hypothetical protein
MNEVIGKNFESGYFINPDQCKALKDHTYFLDGIPDSDKEKIAQKLFSEIEEYSAQQFNNWTTEQPTAKPTRVIKSDIKTIDNFLELLAKIHIDAPASMSGTFFSMNKECSNAKAFAKKLKHDLETLQTGKAKCNQSDLLILQKRRYYSNIKTKEDIENTITEILKDYSLTRYTTDRRPIYKEFIAAFK